MVPENVIKAYGVNGYPTTFLINPEGKICARGLRGENLVELVLEKMGLPAIGYMFWLLCLNSL